VSHRQMQRTGRTSLTRPTCYRRTLAPVIDAGILEFYKREAIEEIGLTKKTVTAFREVVTLTSRQSRLHGASNMGGVRLQRHRSLMGRIAGASSDARATAADVKSLADILSMEAGSLIAEAHRFLTVAST